MTDVAFILLSAFSKKKNQLSPLPHVPIISPSSLIGGIVAVIIITAFGTWLIWKFTFPPPFDPFVESKELDAPGVKGASSSREDEGRVNFPC
ncbi:hypothetical protein K1719_011782 [Acacia pycnantha]|nr:hypothetical protein K1719_011782 [Acacia pycnantha]